MTLDPPAVSWHFLLQHENKHLSSAPQRALGEGRSIPSYGPNNALGFEHMLSLHQQLTCLGVKLCSKFILKRKAKNLGKGFKTKNILMWRIPLSYSKCLQIISNTAFLSIFFYMHFDAEPRGVTTWCTPKQVCWSELVFWSIEMFWLPDCSKIKGRGCAAQQCHNVGKTS